MKRLRKKKEAARLKRSRRKYRVKLLGHHRRWEALAMWFDPLIDPSRFVFGESYLPRSEADRAQAYVVCAMRQLFNRDLGRALRDYSDAFTQALRVFDEPIFPRVVEKLQASMTDASFEVEPAHVSLQSVIDAVALFERSNRPSSPDGYFTARVHKDRLKDIIPVETWLGQRGEPPPSETHDWPWIGVLELGHGPVYIYRVPGIVPEVPCPSCGGSGDGKANYGPSPEDEPCSQCGGYGSIPQSYVNQTVASPPGVRPRLTVTPYWDARELFQKQSERDSLSEDS